MENKELKYENFLYDVDVLTRPLVEELHEYLLKNGLSVKLTMAKSGYVVSYVLNSTKHTILNYVFRKKGLMVRIYGDHVERYQDFLNTLPAEMKKAIVKSPVCRRLLDPTKCNQHCPMGNVFALDGEEYKKCRYGLLFPMNDDTFTSIRAFVERELKERESA